jgi:hypothetical protein
VVVRKERGGGVLGGDRKGGKEREGMIRRRMQIGKEIT